MDNIQDLESELCRNITSDSSVVNSHKSKDRVSSSYLKFLKLRYINTWLIIGCCSFVAIIPIFISSLLARLIAVLWYACGGKRVAIARGNLRYCYPDSSELEREKRLKSILVNFTLGLVDWALVWFRPGWALPKIEVEGMDLLRAARQQGRGVLLVGGHFSMLEISGAILGRLCPLSVVYRPHNNPLLDLLITRSRKTYAQNNIERKDLRAMVRSLRRGEVLWYAPDQDFGHKDSIFINFFNHPAATLTTTGRLAEIGGAKVLCLLFYREGNRRYIKVSNELNSIPSGCHITDAKNYNAWLESKVRLYPEQYLWLHRRFKTRPPGEPDVYRL